MRVTSFSHDWIRSGTLGDLNVTVAGAAPVHPSQARPEPVAVGGTPPAGPLDAYGRTRPEWWVHSAHTGHARSPPLRVAASPHVDPRAPPVSRPAQTVFRPQPHLADRRAVRVEPVGDGARPSGGRPGGRRSEEAQSRCGGRRGDSGTRGGRDKGEQKEREERDEGERGGAEERGLKRG
jgi:hypothetical protein